MNDLKNRDDGAAAEQSGSVGRHTPGPWHARVVIAVRGLERTGYAHQVMIGGVPYTVGHSDHQNYDHIVKTRLDRNYCRFEGVGPREPDLTPCADARLIAAAPDMLEAIKEIRDQTIAIQHSQEVRLNDIFDIATAAIRKATGAA